MILKDFTIPLGSGERTSVYARLAEMGARLFVPGGRPARLDLSDEEILSIAAEESRFDYRLLYVLVALITDHVERFHPFRLRTAVGCMKTPAVWGVIFEFAVKVRDDVDVRSFFSIVLREVKAASPQMFYNSPLRPNPSADGRVIATTCDEFWKWGFYGNEPPLLKELKPSGPVRTFSQESRRRILRQLFREKGEIGVSDYLEALNGAVTRQQAHKDLVSFPRVRKISDRRGRRYRVSS